MASLSFFWHDYETFGRVPRRDRPAQFAGVRTDADLNEVEAPVMVYCQPPTDRLPEPEACLLTGITPQLCQAQGLPEHQFAQAIERELARPGTVGVGYNSIRFDDEVTRFLFWRNLIEPYSREWQNDCARWDLMDLLRCAYALRPDGIEWPLREDGKPSFKLGDLAAANGLVHEVAHDALSDVRATIALARLLKSRQPRLWDFCFKLRHKAAVQSELLLGRPVLHISGMYPAERGCMALVFPLAPHPSNKNEVIVWDLAQDPSTLMSLNAEQIRQRLFTRTEDLPEGVTRLPLKTIHINKSPIVISQLATLSDARASHWQIDKALAHKHAEIAARLVGPMAGVWPGVFSRDAPAGAVDVDEDLYGGFVGPEDRRQLERLRGLSGPALAKERVSFKDARLEELLFRYRARNFLATLNAEDQARWLEHRREQLLGDGPGPAPAAAFQDHLEVLANELEEGAAQGQKQDRAQEILESLSDWMDAITPDA